MEFRHRSQEELAGRLKATDAKDFVPPIESVERLVEHTAQELKEKYPKRFELYVKWLREKDRMSEEDRGEMKHWLHAMNALDEYAFFSREDEDATLRERQKDVFDSIRDHIEAGKRMGYVQLPTGVGKTVLFIELAEAINGKTLVVTSRKNLVEQTVNEFSKFAEGLDVGGSLYGS